MRKSVSLLLALVVLVSTLCVFPTKVSAVINTDRVITATLTIIGYNEGKYASVNANDNGALSIGKLQWHAGRALALMRTIVNALGATTAKSYIGESLYNEIVSSSTNWGSRTLNSTEKSQFSAILGTNASMAAQDELARTDVAKYVNRGIDRGITSDSALVYYSDIENQYGAGSQSANNGAWRLVNGVKGILGKDTIDTLDEFHTALLQFTSSYTTRRNKTYNYVKNLGWSDYYTVTFNMNGHGSAISSQSVANGSTASRPSDPSASGYTFGGWYTSSALTTAFDFSTAIRDNTTVYAKWTAVQTHTHSLVYTAAVSANCNNAGCAAYYRCSGCGKIYTDSSATIETTLSALTVPALGHDYHMTSNTITCTSAGTSIYTCSRCNSTYSVSGAALGHDYYITSHQDPTCTESGYNFYTCSHDASHYYFDTIPATGHTFKNGVCTVCGAAQPAPTNVAGDGDGDRGLRIL